MPIDPAAQARWWAEALGWRITHEEADESTCSSRRPGHRTPCRARPPVPPGARGQGDEEPPAPRPAPRRPGRRGRPPGALGARHVDVGQVGDVSWVVLADPEGNELCLLRALTAASWRVIPHRDPPTAGTVTAMTSTTKKTSPGCSCAGRAVAEARDAMLAAAAPGVSTAELDAVGREVLDRHGADPAPPTVGFPAATCVSVNQRGRPRHPLSDAPPRRRRPPQRRRLRRARRLLGRHRRQRCRRHRVRPARAGSSTRPGWPTATPSPRPGPASPCATSVGPCSAGPAATASP